MWKSAATFKPGEPFRPWVFGVANNIARDRYRRETRRIDTTELETERVGGVRIDPLATSDLERAIATLPDKPARSLPARRRARPRPQRGRQHPEHQPRQRSCTHQPRPRPAPQAPREPGGGVMNEHVRAWLLDGEPPPDGVDLDALVAADAEAQELAEELSQIDSAAAMLPVFGTPPELAASVLATVAQSPQDPVIPNSVQAGPPAAQDPANRPWRRWTFGGVLFAAAAAVMFVLLPGQPPTPEPREHDRQGSRGPERRLRRRPRDVRAHQGRRHRPPAPWRGLSRRRHVLLPLRRPVRRQRAPGAHRRRGCLAPPRREGAVGNGRSDDERACPRL